jgi:hypothetical protein
MVDQAALHEKEATQVCVLLGTKTAPFCTVSWAGPVSEELGQRRVGAARRAGSPKTDRGWNEKRYRNGTETVQFSRLRTVRFYGGKESPASAAATGNQNWSVSCPFLGCSFLFFESVRSPPAKANSIHVLSAQRWMPLTQSYPRSSLGANRSDKAATNIEMILLCTVEKAV